MSQSGFALSPRLAADTVPVCTLALCQVLLMNNTDWPWLILVPRREAVRELIDLSEADQQQLTREIAVASAVLQHEYQPYKLNVAALGNVVEQLHVHVIARHTTDPAWPAPVWNLRPATPYGDAALSATLAALRAAFASR